MFFQSEEITYTCLSFDEANILIENYRKLDHAAIIARIDNLMKNTKDSHLQKELQSLLIKLQNLTLQEYELLIRDIEAGTVAFPPNYQLPHLG